MRFGAWTRRAGGDASTLMWALSRATATAGQLPRADRSRSREVRQLPNALGGGPRGACWSPCTLPVGALPAV